MQNTTSIMMIIVKYYNNNFLNQYIIKWFVFSERYNVYLCRSKCVSQWRKNEACKAEFLYRHCDTSLLTTQVHCALL